MKLLMERGFEVICIANYDEYSEKLEQNGVTFIRSVLENKGKNPVNDYRYFRFLYKAYKKLNPSLIFHYTIKPNIYGSIAAKKAGIPSIAIVSGAGYAFIKDNLLTNVARKLYTKAALSCNEMWFVNDEDQQLFKEQKITQFTKTKVLPGEGINTDIFKRDTPYPVNNLKFTFLLGGRMLWDKGVGVYVEAARIIKEKYADTTFQLLGFIDGLNPSSIDKEQMDSWIKEGVIEYLGSTDNVKLFLNKINCFVLPSFYKEGVPKSLMEAASLEIPLITTDNVGCREVVVNGYNGFLCAIKDHDSLAEKMELMISMPKKDLVTMGINGRKKIIAEFHESLVLEFYVNAIDQYIKQIQPIQHLQS